MIAWDRNSERRGALEARGGQPAEAPSEVVSRAGVVITMLPTAAIVLDVVGPLLEDWPEGTVWLQMSSVGASEADQLTRLAEAHGITLVDAPVSGSTHPAEDGQLTILASGADSARTAVEPIFDALASRVLWVGEAGMGSRLKLATNHWMISTVAALAVREVEQSSRSAMPLLDVVLERFLAAGQALGDQDLAAIYELDEPASTKARVSHQ